LPATAAAVLATSALYGRRSARDRNPAIAVAAVEVGQLRCGVRRVLQDRGHVPPFAESSSGRQEQCAISTVAVAMTLPAEMYRLNAADKRKYRDLAQQWREIG
jgi:hypothetical protein